MRRVYVQLGSLLALLGGETATEKLCVCGLFIYLFLKCVCVCVARCVLGLPVVL